MRYYSVCRVTPTFGSGSYRPQLAYQKAPFGYIFHDDSNQLKIEDLLKPLFRLSKLYNDASKALVFKVSEDTLVATFSLRGFPHPTHLPVYGNRDGHRLLDGRNTLTGWLIRNVKSLSIDPVPIDYGNVFDNCIQLSRHAGKCPCDLLKTGQCFEDNVYPNLPEEFDKNALSLDFAEVDIKHHTKAEYSVLYGFEFIKPGLTAERDFVHSYRAWDEVDFSNVDDRRNELQRRGKTRSKAHEFRKENCAKCPYSTKVGNQIKDCGRRYSCTGPVTIDMTYTAIKKAYDESGFEAMNGFTAAQRDYLINLSGSRHSMRDVFSPSRRTAVRMGFFQRKYRASNEWHYYVSADASDLSRRVAYASYAEMRKVFDFLPENPVSEPVDDYVKMGFAFLSMRDCIHGGWGSVHRLHNITRTPSSVEANYTTTRAHSRAWHWDIPDNYTQEIHRLGNWADIVFHGDYPAMAKYIKRS